MKILGLLFIKTLSKRIAACIFNAASVLSVGVHRPPPRNKMGMTQTLRAAEIRQMCKLCRSYIGSTGHSICPRHTPKPSSSLLTWSQPRAMPDVQQEAGDARKMQPIITVSAPGRCKQTKTLPWLREL